MSIESEIARITEAVSGQTDLIGRIASALEGKVAGNGSGKPEQEKSVTITENGTVDVVPDEGHTLSKVTVDVNVESSGGDEDMVAGIVSRTATEISSATAEEVGGHAFYFNEIVREVTLPSVKRVGSHAFYSCYGLEKIYFPAVETIEKYAFNGCRSLVELDMPMLTTVDGTSAFYGCDKLSKVRIPKLMDTGNRTFYQCSALTTIDLPSVNKIGSETFMNCRNLTTVILRSDKVVSISATSNAFKNCVHFYGTQHDTCNPDGLKDGYFYVPRALIEDYKVATYWSTFATQFRAIEDYPEICG